MKLGSKRSAHDRRRAVQAYGDRIVRTVGRLWRVIFMSLLSIMAVTLTVIVGYLWYTYMRMQDVSPQELEQYIATKQEETSFKREAFDHLRETVEARRNNFDHPPEFYDNMFHY